MHRTAPLITLVVAVLAFPAPAGATAPIVTDQGFLLLPEYGPCLVACPVGLAGALAEFIVPESVTGDNHVNGVAFFFSIGEPTKVAVNIHFITHTSLDQVRVCLGDRQVEGGYQCNHGINALVGPAGLTQQVRLEPGDWYYALELWLGADVAYDTTIMVVG